MTRRGWGLLGAGVGLWLASRALGVPEFQMAGVAVLLLVLLAVLFTRITSAQLELRRTLHPPELFHDQTGSVELRIANVGRLPTAVIQVDDTVPARLTETSRFVLDPLPPGQQAVLSYPVHGRRRGRFEVGPLVVRLRDPFGIASRVLRLGDTAEVTIYPPVWELPAGVPLGGHAGTGTEGVASPVSSGDELATIREYVRGDDLRKVHWRSTAHRGKLMVRQDEAPRHPQATMLLDLRTDRHTGTSDLATIEVAISAAASIIYHLAARSFAVRLLVDPVSASTRARPWQDQLRDLAVATPRKDQPMRALLQQLAKGTVGDGGLVAVMTPPNADELRELVRAGRSFQSRVALIVAPKHRHGSSDLDLSRRALRAAGWRVGVQRPGDRLDVCWTELLVQRTRV